MHKGDSDDIIIDYIKTEGLPMKFNNINELSLYLYFNKICSSFYSIFSLIYTKKINDIILSFLQKNYYLLADKEIIHYNFNYLSEKIFPNIFISKSEEKNIFIIFQNTPNFNTSNNNNKISINKLVVELAYKSNGRLDIYLKIHILKSLLHFINNPKLSSYIRVFQKMENDLINLYQSSLQNKLDIDKYEQMAHFFVDINNNKKWDMYLLSLKKLLSDFQNISDNESIQILEKLFIQLLGHFSKKIRNFSYKMLNMIYDVTTWQNKSTFNYDNTYIKYTGEKLIVEINIKKDDFSKNNIVLITSTPNDNINTKSQYISYIQYYSEKIEKNEVKLIFNLGIIKKCGYYDWYLVKFSKGRFANLKILNNKKELIEGKGRFIVLNNFIKKLSIQEILCDLVEAKIEPKTKSILKLGNFKNLENKLEFYNKIQKTNCLYITGALERDNDIIYDEDTKNVIDIAKKDSSFSAVTSLCNISTLLGGDELFLSLVKKAHNLNMKIIIDSFGRISSTKYHRKYKNLLLQYIDKDAINKIYYGSDGKSIKYEESAIFNFRKIKTWETIISDILNLIHKYNIDGIHIDNSISLPKIFEINLNEMFRIDVDGKRAYNDFDILNGLIILPGIEINNELSDEGEIYPNPFFVKMTRKIWNNFPEFIFIGECWFNNKYNTQKKIINLSKSGIVPRMYTLPLIINKSQEKSNNKNNIIENWYKLNHEGLPKGGINIQSSYGQIFPYYNYINEKIILLGINLLFLLPDIPMTFMEEIEDKNCPVAISNIYRIKEKENNINNNKIKIKANKTLIKIYEEIEKETNI